VHRVLVVGVGSIGERHLRCFGSTQRCSMSFCEPNDDLRATITGRHEVKSAYPSLDDALNAGACDAAVIATPAPLHVPMALQLARAGIHVLIEKPLSTSMHGVDDLIKAVAENSITAAVGYTHRAHPAVQGLKKMVHSGRFGRPRQITIVQGHDFAHARPAYRDIYFADRAMGGGAIQDAITHMYNMGE